MKPYKIPHKLESYSGKFPKHELKEAIANRGETIPELLKVLEYTVENLDKLVHDYEYMAHLYALYLLAQFRETRAYPLIVDLFSTTNEGIEDFTGDFITEDLSRVLASVYDGDDVPIKNMIENERLDEFIRSAALDSLIILYLHGHKTRDEILVYLKRLYREKLSRHENYVWGSLAYTSTRLYPDELYDEIKQAFDDELIDPMIMDMKYVDETLKRDKGEVIDELRSDHHHTLIDDTIAEMEWWAVFQPDKPIKSAPIVKKAQGQVVREGRKIGRNEPCPCGSGLKYKKCCGKTQVKS